jgi:hypothetical protein
MEEHTGTASITITIGKQAVLKKLITFQTAAVI